MPYIPQFNKLSLQEQSYAPTLMRQNQDDLVSKQMELAEALKFDYLSQDAPGIEPVLQGYNKDIDDVSKQIAQQGFSHDIKNKVLGLRSKYVTDDKIRTYKKNYSDAMSQWEEQRKKMIQEGRPGDDINRQKTAFFSGYSGAYAPTGEKNEFTAGRTSGYYDIGEDAAKLMSNLGSTQTPIIGQKARIEPYTDPSTGRTAFKMIDSKNGDAITDLKQVDAVKAYLKAEYGDDKTDRGLFAKISNLDESYINNVVDNIAKAKTTTRTIAPQIDTNWGGFGDNSSSGKKRKPFSTSTYLGQSGQPNAKTKIEENVSAISAGIKDGKFDPNNIPNDKKGVMYDIKNAGYFYGNGLADITGQAFDFGKGFLGMKKNESTGENYFEKQQQHLDTSQRDYATQMFNKAKNKYKPVYEQIKRNGGNDQDFINQTSKYEEDMSANMGRKVGLNYPYALKGILGKVYETSKNKAFIDEDGNQISRGQLDKKIKDLGMSKEDFYNRQTLVDSRGQIYFQLPKKEGSSESIEYVVNPESIPEEIKTNKEGLDALESGLTNFQLTQAQLDKIQRHNFEVGGYNFRIIIDPDKSGDKFNRILVSANEDGSVTNEYGEYNRVPLSIIQSLNTQDIAKAIKSEN